MLAWVFGSALLLAIAPESSPEEVRQAYQTARAQAGRSADDQVRLALWCEAHGLTAERLNHLALAVLSDPSHATARGLMGLVADGGRFRRPEAVAEKARNNPILAEYETRRLKAPYNADGQWALGNWAEEHGLKDQARTHYTAVTRLDPTRERAWQRLGYKRRGARWLTDAQAEAEKAEADAQKQADKTWRTRLDSLKTMLDQPAKRPEAESALAAVADPRAVPAVLAVFTAGRRPDPTRAVQLLGQIDSPAAARALASLAVYSRSAPARRLAVETLRSRDPREFVRLWIALVRDPIKFEVRPVGGPGSPGTLFVEGKEANLQRVYAPPALAAIPNRPGMRLDADANGLPVLVEDLGSTQETSGLPAGALGAYVATQPLNTPSARAAAGLILSSPTYSTTTQTQQLRIPIGQMKLEADRAAAVAREQLADDVAALEKVNAEVRRSNEPILTALREITGKDLGADAKSWTKWWVVHQGYAMTDEPAPPTPTIAENVPIAFTPTAGPTVTSSTTTVTAPVPHTKPGKPIILAMPAFRPLFVHSACFAAGTSVRTIKGNRPIESIRAGDLVLAQDSKTGALAYQPVLVALHNPPSPTLRINLGAETIVATGIHRFWKAGKGWTMARDLQVGDPIRGLEGITQVQAITDEINPQPVFNLEVADGHSFLVGRLGVLVHDNSRVEPTPQPFDAALATP